MSVKIFEKFHELMLHPRLYTDSKFKFQIDNMYEVPLD